MKPVQFILYIITAAGMLSCSTTLRVASTAPVNPRESGDFILSGVSPDGKRLMVTRPLYSGLYLIDIRSGYTKTVTDAPGAGYQPAVSPDGRSFCYRTDDYSEGLRYSDLIVRNILTDEQFAVVRHERIVSPPLAVDKAIAYSVNGDQKAGGFRKSIFGHLITKPYVALENLTPVVVREKETTPCKPGGEGSYIWASLSPNRKMLVCYLVSKGTYVCDLKGNQLLFLPNLTNPKWLDNKHIVGIEPHSSDGKSTATDLVGYAVRKGTRYLLTNTPAVSERNPHPYDKGRKIAFQTASGSINTLTIRKK